ncbi:HN1_G0000380.mRNA.1.CDS.1 [Saccharomyces cerevisiae]|nr:HN1_G0000380.mRNA.1.CDS.1 [Saccharomyces cerevisiae]CAI4394616.1 BAL_1a_G0013900.mRNA.1.CDS.1 [Saccharomyces cerevisiae]CAI7097574.1 BAL_1a_G0013900.mRNA.1.CDS.1 [Saccharomyces cerevisiae]
MKKEKKTPTPLPSHHVLFAEPAYTNKSFFLFSIYFVIYHLYSNNILCFYSYFTLFFLMQCNSLGRMIFMCAYLPAAGSRSVANPALPPQKKKKGTLRTGEVEEQVKGNISFYLCGKRNFQ